MSLTSYRAAPPRANISCPEAAKTPKGRDPYGSRPLACEWYHQILTRAPAAMPGDDLLFQRLSGSTIGAVRFHGRVRDGIGWVTDAMVTKQWSRRDWEAKGFRAFGR